MLVAEGLERLIDQRGEVEQRKVAAKCGADRCGARNRALTTGILRFIWGPYAGGAPEFGRPARPSGSLPKDARLGFDAVFQLMRAVTLVPAK